MGLMLAFRLFVHLGLPADYRRQFRSTFGYTLRRGQVDADLGMGFVAFHQINFTREALRGEQNASFYSSRQREAAERLPAASG